MKRKAVPVLAAVLLIVIVAAIGIASKIVEKYTPSEEVMSSVEYYGISGGNEMALIIQDELVEEKGLLEGSIPYLPYQAVRTYLNERFYWDADAAQLVYTTSTEIIHIPAEGSAYTVAGNPQDAGYTVAKAVGDEVYIAAPFVQQYTNMEYELYPEPNRLLVTCRWEETSYAETKKDEAVRYQGGIKSPILTQAPAGTKLTVLEQMEDWTKVLTPDGYIGYVRNKKLSDIYKEMVSRAFEEPVYTSIQRDHKINLVWHQITSMEANASLADDIAGMKGVNVISPTWFSIASNEGDITSLASEEYVALAHSQGLEVWGLVDNFSEAVDTETVLKSNAARERLSDQLLAAALQYGLEGVNIDFEAIPETAAEGYIQFIREMSVKCRNNGIVLSVDVPVPMPYTSFYNRREQGVVADYVIMMGYDEHYDGSEKAGSVASLSFEKTGIEEMLKEVPAQKVISAVPFYTRLWSTDPSGNVTSQALGMSSAEQWLTDNGVTAYWSQETSQDYAELTADDGSKYQIWLENEKSLEEKAKLVQDYSLGGIAAWKLGLERPSVWDVLSKYVD